MTGVKKAMVGRFINPELCKITEDFVLTNPYEDRDKCLPRRGHPGG